MSAEILIIDDNSDIREILNDLIIEAGYSTRLAANYNQALSEIDKKLPDVAIIDVKLDKGDNDGIELLNHIKRKNTNIPVIIISGHANIDMAIKSLKSGAFEFIQKPFDKERLMNFIKRAVENFNLKVLNENLMNLSIHDQALIVTDTISNFLERDQNDKFQIIFLDPPFAENNYIQDLETIYQKKFYTKNHLIIIHRDRKNSENFRDVFSP